LAEITEQVTAIIEAPLEAMGYRLVRVMVMGSQRRATLQIMAERQDEAAMTVDDCADISRSVSALLDVADPIAGAYMLEVSSPGIDRPLVRPEDYDRFAGFEARIDLAVPLDGRKRFRGRLLGRAADAADHVRLAAETGEVRLPLTAIARAKLVLTDDLLAAHSAQTAGGRDRSAVQAPVTAFMVPAEANQVRPSVRPPEAELLKVWLLP